MDINSLKIAIDTRDAITAKDNLDKLGKSSKDLDSNVSKAVQSLSSFKGIIATIATGAVISNYIKFADTFTNINSKLTLATKNTSELAKAQRELFTISQQSRVSFESTVDLYSKLSTSTEQLKIKQDDLLKVTSLINKAGIIGGGSSESINAALMQLGQGFASGTLRGEELNSVMEQTPRLARAIAEGMGVTVGELRKLGEQGSITAEKVINALLNQSNTIDKEFTKMTATVSQSMTVLENSMISAVGTIDKLTGASGIVAKSMMGWSWAIDQVNKSLKLTFGDISSMTDKVDLIAKRNELLKEKLTIKNDKFMWDSEQKQKISEIDKQLMQVSGRLATLFEEEEKVTVSTNKVVDGWDKLTDSTKKAIDPIRVIRDEYKKLREDLKNQKLDTPENISAINAKEAEAIASATKKANVDSIKSQKEFNKSVNETAKAYEDIAKLGMTEYEKALYDIKLQSIEFINTTGDVTTALKMQSIAEDELNKKQTENNLKELTEAEKKRKEEIDKRLVSLNREYDLKEKQAGLIVDEVERNSTLAKLYNERQKEELKAQKDKGEITDSYYQASLAYEKELMTRTLFRYSQTGQIIESVSSGMKSTMMDFFDYTSDGFGNLKKLTIDLGNMIYKSITQQMVVNPLVNALSSAATSYFTPSVASAKGNVFESPSLSQYSNSVVSKPTTFAFATGGVPSMGVMGEKNGGSPEAIIPLTRTSNGDLGVKSIDTNNKGIVKVEVINQTNDKVQITNTSTRNDLEGTILSIIIGGIQNNKMGMRNLIQGAR